MNECSPAYTFLYTTETPDSPAAVKFESYLHGSSEFTVTVLNEPGIAPFRMRLEEDEWNISGEVCHKVKALEHELKRVAKKFRR